MADKDFTIINEFKGYRNKEDITNLAPGYLVVGSQNVLTTTSSRLSARKGYTLDGQEDINNIAPILSSYDWYTNLGLQRNIRVGNGKFQVRYVATAGDYYNGTTFTEGEVYWLDLMTTTSNYANFADYWDSTNLYSLLLMTNQTAGINYWAGGIATLASTTVNTITKTGTGTWLESGFLNFGTRQLIINGTTYSYTGGESTTTLTGVTADPTSEPVDSIIIQKPVSVASSGITSLPTTYRIDLIAIRENQVYYGSQVSRTVYISVQNNYASVAYTSPVRVVGEGGRLILDDVPTSFINQEDAMYIAAGKNYWFRTLFQLSSDNSKQTLITEPLKVAPLQAAQSQGLTAKIKNDVVFINSEPTLDSLGRISGVIATPQSTNISDPIKIDFDSYDFTDGHIIYFRNFIYISVPRQGIVRVFNLAKGFWEAPLTLPICRFAIIDGELYGHSYQTPQTFKLFNGYSDNGNPISVKMKFSYMNFGTRTQSKFFNEAYFEGYIQANTTINYGVKYEIDGCATETSYMINGSDTQVVCISSTDGSLGKVPLGKNPLGSSLNTVNTLPKMRGIKTFPRNDFYEVQFSFSSYGLDHAWEILAFGALVESSPYGNNAIKQ